MADYNIQDFSNYWEEMGLLKYIKPENVDSAIKLYEELVQYTDTEEFKDYIYDTYLEEWWNSFLPLSTAEWSEIGIDESEIEMYEEEYKYYDDIAVNLIFAVAHNMLKKFKNVTIDDLIDVLSNVTMEPLITFDDITELNGYNALFKTAKKIFNEQCEAFYEINFILKK